MRYFFVVSSYKFTSIFAFIMIQKKHFSLASITLYSLMLMAFCIPLHKKMFVPCAIVSFILVLIQFNKKQVVERLRSFKFLYTLIIYYCIVAMGLLWTENIPEGLFDLEIKLSFILFPVYFFIFPLNPDKSIQSRVIFSYLSGVGLSVLICLVNAGINYIEQPVFYYTFAASSFSILHHPTYFAMYINFAIVILLIWQRQHKIKSIPAVLACIVLLGTNWLLMSRAGLLTSILIVFTYWLTLFFERKYKGAIIMLMLLVISSLAVYNFSSYAKFRMSTIIPFIQDLVSKKPKDETTTTTTDSRMITWKAAISVISKNPLLGAGTGDVHSELNKYYQQTYNEAALEKNLNAHNQFLQSWVATGIFGFLSILLILYVGIAKALKKQDYLVFFFFLVSMITMMTESIFETQSGVVFFAFFSALFLATREQTAAILSDKKQ